MRSLPVFLFSCGFQILSPRSKLRPFISHRLASGSRNHSKRQQKLCCSKDCENMLSPAVTASKGNDTLTHIMGKKSTCITCTCKKKVYKKVGRVTFPGGGDSKSVLDSASAPAAADLHFPASGHEKSTFESRERDRRTGWGKETGLPENMVHKEEVSERERKCRTAILILVCADRFPAASSHLLPEFHSRFLGIITVSGGGGFGRRR